MAGTGQAGLDIYWMVRNDPSRLLKLLDKDALRSLLNDFTGATGLTANIIGTDGKSIFNRKDAQNMCTFCQLVRKLQKKTGVNRCVASYETAGKEAYEAGEARIFRCPAGLVEMVTPITRDGVHVGSVICGQILMWEPDDFFWIELEQCNRELTDDMAPLIEAAKELPVVPSEKVRAASRLIGVVADKVVEALWERIQRERESTFQKRMLEREQITRKKLESALNVGNMTYFFDQCKTLLNAISTSNFKEARRLATVVLADCIAPGVPYDLAQLQISYLVFSLWHQAIEVTREDVKSTEIVIAYRESTLLASDREALGTIAHDTLDSQLALVEENARPGRPAVETMCGYIKSHLKDSFSVQDVAASVELSPYYASRMFKKDQGVTIMEYATRLRMEEAKLLLGNPSYRIDEIAAQIGYADSSYFARVFKKHEGMSPRAWRSCH